MKRILFIVLLFLALGLLSACSSERDNAQQLKPREESNPSLESEAKETAQIAGDNDKSMDKNENYRIKIKVAGKELFADLYPNSTSKAMLEKLPMTVEMRDLYNREMAYFFAQELPTDKVELSDYEVGEIIYWPPRNTLVIMYAQNGEKFSMQKLGRIDSGVEVFEGTGDTEVTFELLDTADQG